MQKKFLLLSFVIILSSLTSIFTFADTTGGDSEINSGATITTTTNEDTGDTISGTNEETLPEILIDTGTMTIYVSGYVESTGNTSTGNQTDTTGTIEKTGDTIIFTGDSNINPADEFANALAWMYANGLTMYNNSGDYRMYDLLTREEAAKMIGQAYKVFGGDENLIKNNSCTFNDSNLFNPTLAPYITNVCKWGLFQGANGNYLPNESLSKSQAMAVLIRMIEGKMSYELQTPRWEQYYTKGKLIGLTNIENINDFDHDVTRYEIALMIYRMRTIMGNAQMKQLALNAMAGINQSTGTIDSQTVKDNLSTLVGEIDTSSDPELAEAIYRMAENELTIHKTVADYKPFDTLTRAGAAKIFDKFSDMIGLGTSQEYLPNECNFTDIGGLDTETQSHIINVCKKGLIKGGNNLYNPNDDMNKSAFIVALIRMFEGKSLDETVSPRWKNYFDKAQELGLVTAADTTTFDTPISRYEVALFLYRFNVRYKLLNNLNNNKISDDIINTVDGSTITLNGKQTANIYINTSVLKQGTLDLGYVEIFGTRYKIVKTQEKIESSVNGFIWYGDIFDIVTDEKLGTINFMVQNSSVIEGTLRYTDKTYKISPVEGTSAYYKIAES